MGPAGAEGAGKSGRGKTMSVPVVIRHGHRVVASGGTTVTERGGTLEAVSSPGITSALPPLDRSAMDFTHVAYRLPDGDVLPLKVAVSKRGVLVIAISSKPAAKMDGRSLELLGMAIAKVRFGIAPSHIKGVVIESP